MIRSIIVVLVVVTSFSCKKNKNEFSGSYLCNGTSTSGTTVTPVTNESITVSHDGDVVHYSSWDLHLVSNNNYVYNTGDATHQMTLSMHFSGDSVYYNMTSHDDYATPMDFVRVLSGKKI